MVTLALRSPRGAVRGAQSSDLRRRAAGPGAVEQYRVDAAAQLMSLLCPGSRPSSMLCCFAQWRQDFIGAVEANRRKHI